MSARSSSSSSVGAASTSVITCAEAAAAASCPTAALDHLLQQLPDAAAAAPPLPAPYERLCYVHCHLCDTVLAVGVPFSSLLKTVTVRCGHCASLLSVNMGALFLPPVGSVAASPPPQPPLPYLDRFYAAPSPPHPSILDDLTSTSSSIVVDQQQPSFGLQMNGGAGAASTLTSALLPAPTSSKAFREAEASRNLIAQSSTRPAEKRQRVPSAYNRFIKDEIQRIKASNPDITHREAFSAAAKNWAHFPHIHFGLMSEQPVAKRPAAAGGLTQDQQKVDMLCKNSGFYGGAAAAAALNMPW